MDVLPWLLFTVYGIVLITHTGSHDRDATDFAGLFPTLHTNGTLLRQYIVQDQA